MASPIEIDLLYFDGCPSYKTAWALLLAVISERGLEVTVKPVNIDSLAKANRFLRLYTLHQLIHHRSVFQRAHVPADIAA